MATSTHEKLEQLMRHQLDASDVSHYLFNNTTTAWVNTTQYCISMISATAEERAELQYLSFLLLLYKPVNIVINHA